MSPEGSKRMDKAKFTLAELDGGGAWRMAAMKNVQAELEFRLAEAGVENVQVIA